MCAVPALVVAAVAVASLFAAVSEGEAEVPCSVDGDAGFLVSGFWQEASWQLTPVFGAGLYLHLCIRGIRGDHSHCICLTVWHQN